MKSYMSPSGIKKHSDCPKSWWFRYVSDIEPVESDTRYLDLGNAVHEAIEDMLLAEEEVREGIPFLAPAGEVYQRMLHHYNPEQCGVPEDLRETGEECLETAAEFIGDRQPKVRGIEVSKKFTIDRPDLDTEVRGKMDVATENEIWDWKTGSIRDDTPEKEKIQGAAYMAAYHAKYGEPPEKIRFVYLKEEKLRSLDPSDEVWNTMLLHARKLAKSKREDEFEAKPGDACHFCPYEQHCAPAGGVGADFDWEAWTRL